MRKNHSKIVCIKLVHLPYLLLFYVVIFGMGFNTNSVLLYACAENFAGRCVNIQQCQMNTV